MGSPDEHVSSICDVIPKPAGTWPVDDDYHITDATKIVYDSPEAASVADHLDDCLRAGTDLGLPVEGGNHVQSGAGIALLLEDVPEDLGAEGYELTVTADGVDIRANAPAGLFWGVQTLRQLLPPTIEQGTSEQGPWSIPGGRIRDAPRFEYRGVHLDVARHFFDIEDVKRFIDHAIRYKCNHLHLHLTDDQGWRIEIDAWPKLTEIGSSTEVGGGEGGYYTQAEYERLVSYARERFVTVVPEIDVPGHTNAALSAYSELNPDGEAAEPYTGREVGFSTLRVDSETTYEFLDDVFGEITAMTPGPYLHIGGDEVEKLTDEEYAGFVERVEDIVEDHGKRPMGWHEILGADLSPSTVIQYWSDNPQAEGIDAAGAAENGHEFVLSPASHTYLDIKYDEDSELGVDWAGHTSVMDAYEWDPGEYVVGVDETAVLGVEAAVWTEPLETMGEIEFMLFPRLPAIAERGWTPAAETGWDDFRRRLAKQAPRWELADIEFYRAPEIDWENGGT